MKKRIVMFLSVSLIAVLLAGCGTTSREQELEDQVAQLEQQVADLQGAADDTAASDTQDTTASGSAEESTTTDTTADTTASANDFDTLSQKVADEVANADAAQPSGTAADDRALFFERKTALDALDRELDAYEDDLEAQYRNGTLDYTAFRQQDREVEKLEDDLDDAEDRLENRFGIDD